MKLNIYAEFHGEQQRVGLIDTRQGEELFFYDEEWVHSHPTCSLSLSMPIASATFRSREIKPYFEGLLPEENARTSLAQDLGVSPTSYLKILAHVGLECIGAVQIVPESEDQSKGANPEYEELSPEAVQSIVQSGHAGASQMQAASRLSLAGAQAKVGLYRGSDGRWYQPFGTAPATHIIKSVNKAFPGLAINELLCMRTARACGLPAADVELLDSNLDAVSVARYDRQLSESLHAVSDLLIPLRLHQEDMAQALGILPIDKYENSGNHYVEQMANLLRAWSSNPIRDLIQLCDLVIFDYLIGNCDNHLKNFSICYSSNWSERSLAPAYDRVSTVLYPDLTRTMGVAIGETRKLDAISMRDFEEFANQLGISQNTVLERLDTLSSQVDSAMQTESAKLTEAGHYQAAEVSGRILEDMNRRLRALA